MPTAEDVLRAIRETAAATGDRNAELSYHDVAKRIGCAADDPDFQKYLARAATTGLIESTAEIDQLPGPIAFRLAD